MAILSDRLVVKEFVSNFELLSEASGGTTRLRELTVELATRGALPGFDPSSWRSVMLSDVVADFQNGTSKRRGDTGTPIPVLRLADIESGARLRNENLRELLLTSEEQEKYRVRQGDVLVIRVNGSADLVGRFVPCNVSRIWAYSDHLIRLRLRPDLIDAAYISAVARSASARKYLATKTVTTAGQKTVNQVGLAGLPLLLPPLAEQKRIVARVDQLMALIDDLEAKQTKKREVQTRFRTSAPGALTRAEGPEEFAAAWKRVAGNFGVLFERVESVPQLRMAIVEQAVRGRLVPQFADDEPAEHVRLRLADRLRRKAPDGQAEEVPRPFELPRGWAWAKLPELGEFGRGKSKHRPRNDPSLFSNGTYPLVQTGDVARSGGSITTYTSMYNEKGLAQSRVWPKGTLCITIAANIADSGILTFDACFPDSVVGFVPDPEIGDARYFEFFLRTAQQEIEKFAPATAQKNINLEILSQVMVPLPPVPEIRRIVAKVEALMQLCDDLEAKLRVKEETAGKLVEAVVKELVA